MNDRRRPVKADERTPVDAAIDEVERQAMEQELAMLEHREATRIPLLTTPHTWTGNEEITVDAIPDDVPTFLMWDAAQGGFRPIILPAGTRWRITPDRTALWTPAQGAPR